MQGHPFYPVRIFTVLPVCVTCLGRTSSHDVPRHLSQGLYPSVFLTALAACCFLFLLYLGSHKVAFTFVISFRFENGGEFTPELEDGDDPTAYVTNLSYYHLVPFETDILD